MRSCLVIVPTYNEAQGIEALLQKVLAVHPDLRILVVDDGSPDGTGDIVKNLAQTCSRIELLERQTKQGLGRAYIAGFHHGLERGFEHLIEMDADLSHDPSDLPRLFEASQRAQLVIGSRYVAGGEVAGWSRLREALSRSANLYARTVLGLPVRDLTAGYRCYRRQVLEALDLETVSSEGYAFQVEMTYRTIKAGFRVVEIPIVFKERASGQSKMSRRIALEGLTWVAGQGVRDFPHRLLNLRQG